MGSFKGDGRAQGRPGRRAGSAGILSAWVGTTLVMFVRSRTSELPEKARGFSLSKQGWRPGLVVVACRSGGHELPHKVGGLLRDRDGRDYGWSGGQGPPK